MKNEEPKSLLEVLEWKEKAYQEVAHLPRKLALAKRIKDSSQTLKELGLVKTNKLTGNIQVVETVDCN